MYNVLVKCATEHPHHTLPILFNLKNSEKDKCILNASKALSRGGARGAGVSRGGAGEERGAAAAALVARLAAPAAPLAALLAQMELLCDGNIKYILWDF